MKRICILLLAIVMILAVTASAQPKMPTIDEQIERLTERLELTDDQVAKVEAIFDSSNVAELTKQMEENKGDREAMHETMTAMRAEMEKINEEITDILNDEQKEEFRNMLQERPQGPPPGGRPDGGQGGGERGR